MLKIGSPVAIKGTVHEGVVKRGNLIDVKDDKSGEVVDQRAEHLVAYKDHDGEDTERWFREDQLTAKPAKGAK